MPGATASSGVDDGGSADCSNIAMSASCLVTASLSIPAPATLFRTNATASSDAFRNWLIKFMEVTAGGGRCRNLLRGRKHGDTVRKSIDHPIDACDLVLRRGGRAFKLLELRGFFIDPLSLSYLLLLLLSSQLLLLLTKITNMMI